MTILATGQALGPAVSLTQWLPPFLMVAGVTLLGVVAALLLRSRRPNAAAPGSSHNDPDRPGPEPTPSDTAAAAAHARKLRQEAQHWVAQLDRRITELRTLLDERDDASYESSSTPPAPEAAATPVQPRPGPPLLHAEDRQPLVEVVHKLADQGRSPVEIARHLNEHVGKVELILALRAMNGASADRHE